METLGNTESSAVLVFKVYSIESVAGFRRARKAGVLDGVSGLTQ